LLHDLDRFKSFVDASSWAGRPGGGLMASTPTRGKTSDEAPASATRPGVCAGPRRVVGVRLAGAPGDAGAINLDAVEQNGAERTEALSGATAQEPSSPLRPRGFLATAGLLML
jgi:hypothetical protein